MLETVKMIQSMAQISQTPNISCRLRFLLIRVGKVPSLAKIDVYLKNYWYLKAIEIVVV